MATETTYITKDDEVSLKEFILNIQDWIRYLWSKKLIMLIVVIIGALTGLCYSFWKRPLYTAVTTFVLESGESKGGLGRLAGMAAVAGIDLSGGAGSIFQGDNILELYRSRIMLERTLLSKINPDSNELLIDRYIVYNGLKEQWERKQPELLTLDFHKTELDSASLRLRNGVISSFVNAISANILQVDRPDSKQSIIRVEVTSPDEVFSKAFNENLVSEVNEFYIQTKTKKSNRSIAILQHKVDSVRTEMTNAIYSGAEIGDATPNLNPTRQVNRVAPLQKAQFAADANKAMLSQLLQNLELTRINLLQEQPLIQLVDQPVYPLPIKKISKLKGMIMGGFLFGFSALMCLLLLKWYRDIMTGDEKKILEER